MPQWKRNAVDGLLLLSLLLVAVKLIWGLDRLPWFAVFIPAALPLPVMIVCWLRRWRD